MFGENFMVGLKRNGDPEAFSSDYFVPRSNPPYMNLRLNDLVFRESPSSRASQPFMYPPSSSLPNGFSSLPFEFSSSNRASQPLEFSPPSSFSGFSSSDDGFSPFSTNTPTAPFVNGQNRFNMNINDGLVDDLDLSLNLFRMSIADDEKSATQISPFHMDHPKSSLSRSGFESIPLGIPSRNNYNEYYPKGFSAITQNFSNNPSAGFIDNPYCNASGCSAESNMGFDVRNMSNGVMMSDEIRVPQSYLPLVATGEIGKSTYEDGLIIHRNGFKLPAYDPHNLSKGRKCSLDIEKVQRVYGSVYLMARDQNGCRYLQKIFDEGSVLDVVLIFNHIVDQVIELMLDPFGNYFVQKLLDVCNEEQRLKIVYVMISRPGLLINICLNPYGTRVVQKLIETLGTRQQVTVIKSALKQGILHLVRDLNGNHVIKRCLQCLSTEDNQFIYDAALKFCVDIATHRHGCCVLQRCVSHSVGTQRDKLVAEIFRNGLLLAQDPFGNYVVQYIIEQKDISVAPNNLLYQFKGHYIDLSTQKFSSHVVEKCLKHYPESRIQIIRELVSASRFEQLLQDPFANYVIQSALAVTKGPLRACLVDAVRDHYGLRTSPYCKRIFSRKLLKN